MSDEQDDKEGRDVAIQAGLQLIPYVGGSISTLYFGKKQEQRFQRIESFYTELANEIGAIKDSIRDVDDQDPEKFSAILESLHDRIEKEPINEKREFFKNYLKSTLKSPVGANYDERKYFLDSIAEMSLLECEILGFLRNQKDRLKVGDIQKPGVNPYAIVGAIGRLRTRGFVSAAQGGFMIGGKQDNSLEENVSITEYGESFCKFCMDA